MGTVLDAELSSRIEIHDSEVILSGLSGLDSFPDFLFCCVFFWVAIPEGA